MFALAARPIAGKPSLIVCPASVVPVWREEINKFYPHLIVDAEDRARFHAARMPPSGRQLHPARSTARCSVASTGYAVLTKASSQESRREDHADLLCRALLHRVVLTGTPLKPPADSEHLPLSPAASVRAARRGLLGADRRARSRLRAQLAPFILRRTKREVAQELPPKVEMDSFARSRRSAEYARICSDGLERLGDDVAPRCGEVPGFLRSSRACARPVATMLPWLKAPSLTPARSTCSRNSPRLSATGTKW